MPAALWNPFSMIATPPARVYEDAVSTKTAESTERKLVHAGNSEVRTGIEHKTDAMADTKNDVKMGVLAEDADDEVLEKREKTDKSEKSEKSEKPEKLNQRERAQRLEKEKSDKLEKSEKSEKSERNDKDEEIALLRAQMQQTQELLRRILEGGFVPPQSLGMMPAMTTHVQPPAEPTSEDTATDDVAEEAPILPKATKTRSRRSKV